MVDVDSNDSVRCERCRARFGKQSETALILGTIWVEKDLDFFCKQCGASNRWVSKSVLLEQEAAQALADKEAADANAALLAKQLADTQAALDAEKKKPKK